MIFQKISKTKGVSGNLVEKVSKLDDRRVLFQKISKTKGVFGNLVEIRGQMIEKRVFFQKISNIEVCFGNLVEKSWDGVVWGKRFANRSPILRFR